MDGKPQSEKCKSCNQLGRVKPRREASPRWHGGRIVTARGYVKINMDRDNFFFPMADKAGRVPEHRLVMAKSIGRCLQNWEIVHHKNGIKGDNRIENLQLVTDDRHKQITILSNKIEQLKKENSALQKRINFLLCEVTNLKSTIMEERNDHTANSNKPNQRQLV